MQEMRDYFKKYEPDAVFMPGQQYREGGATHADDTNALTPEDWDAIVSGWRGLQHRDVYYEQPPIKGRPPRGAFTLPDFAVNALGAGDPKVAGQ
jgi:hypothetical protein